MAAGSGDTGGPFKGAWRRRRRPTAAGDEKEGLGFGGERRIRFELESNDFQTDLADVSKGEKVEEISRIISPLLIRPEKERIGRIGKRRRRRGARVSGGGRREEDDDLTDGPHLSATARTRARLRLDWAEERETDPIRPRIHELPKRFRR